MIFTSSCSTSFPYTTLFRSNMGTERGLPISCFNVFVPDSIEGITHKLGEVIMQTKIGGGTSGYFGSLRERGSAVTDNGKSRDLKSTRLNSSHVAISYAVYCL